MAGAPRSGATAVAVVRQHATESHTLLRRSTRPLLRRGVRSIEGRGRGWNAGRRGVCARWVRVQRGCYRFRLALETSSGKAGTERGERAQRSAAKGRRRNGRARAEAKSADGRQRKECKQRQGCKSTLVSAAMQRCGALMFLRSVWYLHCSSFLIGSIGSPKRWLAVLACVDDARSSRDCYGLSLAERSSSAVAVEVLISYNRDIVACNRQGRLRSCRGCSSNTDSTQNKPHGSHAQRQRRSARRT